MSYCVYIVSLYVFPSNFNTNRVTLSVSVPNIPSSHSFVDPSFWLETHETYFQSFCVHSTNVNNPLIQNSITYFNFHNPVTDSNFIFIFKEDVPLLFFKDIMCGLSSVGFLYTRCFSLLVYTCMVFIKCTSHYLNIRLFRHLTQCRKCKPQWCNASRIRQYLAISRRALFVHISVAPVFLLLILCGDIHPNPGPVLPGSSRHPEMQVLNVAAWNVRTLLDTKRTAIRPTAIVARELARYNIDIAALSETRIKGDSVIKEVGGGYTFFLKGKPEGDRSDYGVGFAIRSKLVKVLQGKYPVGINERLMTMTLPLVDHTLSIISAYAPTLKQSDETKACFYGSLGDAINAVPSSHKLLVMGDFNARVGTDHLDWVNIIGKQGVGNENSNGTLLLSLCAQNELCITNTFFQQSTRHKTTWMHPGTKQWHMIDYVITRQRDIKDVFHTRAMCGSCTWSDHRLVRSKIALKPKNSQRRTRLKPQRRPDLSKLKSALVRETLATKLQEGYAAADLPGPTPQDSWDIFKDVTQKITEEVLGFPERKHRDWFDENDPLIQPLLEQLNALHIKAIEDSNNNVKANHYRACKQLVQKSLRNIKDAWWQARAVELQDAADRRDFKTFYQGLKTVHGPIHLASPSIRSKDGVLLTKPSEVLDRWAGHFHTVLNQQSNFDMSVLEDIPQRDTDISLDAVPTLKEVLLSIKQLTSGKSPGEDGIPPDIYKHGGIAIAEQVLKVFKQIWQDGGVIQAFKDATIVHLYKNKGDRHCCDNHRGISLLCIAGKILARLILNRLDKHIHKLGVIPESQCGFCAGRGTTDMVFALRQLQEKCVFQNQDLYLLFIDLTKAFDTIHREGLWCILEKAGCPSHFVGIIRSFHDGMKASVKEGNEKSPSFGVTSGTKQGCVLAPTLFSIFFSMMLHVAFKDSTDGVDIKSRFDVGIGHINTKHFNAVTKVTVSTIRDLLFADDCALAACSVEAIQRLCDCFSTAARRFGLTISIKKTEVLYQPARGNVYVPPNISIEGKQLNAVENFKYLGSTISNDATIDAEITARIAKATVAYGRLTKRLWTNRNIRLVTKVAVYKAAVVTSLLYGCETWTLRKAHITRLEKFHQSSLRKIARIKWFHKVPNYEVLSRCNICSLQSMIDSAHLRWTGHVTRMQNYRIPKALMYGHIQSGTSSRGRHTTYLNSVKNTLRGCSINPAHLEKLAAKRETWRTTYKAGIAIAENIRINRLIDKRQKRIARRDLAQQPS